MKKDEIPFFPNHALTELIVAYVAFAILITLAILYPAPLEDKANPVVTPPHIKPEWYYLFMYQALKYFTTDIFGKHADLIGITAVGLFFAVLFLVPFLDRGEERHPRERKVTVGLGILAIILILILTILGMIS